MYKKYCLLLSYRFTSAFMHVENQLLHLAKKYATTMLQNNITPVLYHTQVSFILQEGWQIYI